jgi:hypothetical protein
MPYTLTTEEIEKALSQVNFNNLGPLLTQAEGEFGRFKELRTKLIEALLGGLSLGDLFDCMQWAGDKKIDLDAVEQQCNNQKNLKQFLEAMKGGVQSRQFYSANDFYGAVPSNAGLQQQQVFFMGEDRGAPNKKGGANQPAPNPMVRIVAMLLGIIGSTGAFGPPTTTRAYNITTTTTTVTTPAPTSSPAAPPSPIWVIILIVVLLLILLIVLVYYFRRGIGSAWNNLRGYDNLPQ